MKTKKSACGGFTLIELLTVISIIGILGSLLFPAFSIAKSKVQTSHCRNSLRQIGLAFLGYAQENQSYPLYGRLPTAFEPYGAKWYSDIMPDLPEVWKSKIYRCPTYRGITYDSRPDQDGLNMYVSVGSYAYNGGSTSGTRHYLYGLSRKYHEGWWDIPGEMLPVNESEVVSPSDMIALGDSISRTHDPDPLRVLMNGTDFLSRSMNIYYNVGESGASERHKRMSNIAFADGHVEAMTFGQLFFDRDENALRRWHTDHEPHWELFH